MRLTIQGMRELLEVDKAEVAERMGIPLSLYEKIEQEDDPRMYTKVKGKLLKERVKLINYLR